MVAFHERLGAKCRRIAQILKILKIEIPRRRRGRRDGGDRAVSEARLDDLDASSCIGCRLRFGQTRGCDSTPSVKPESE